MTGTGIVQRMHLPTLRLVGCLLLLVGVSCDTSVPTGTCSPKSCQGCCDRDTCVPLTGQSDSLCGAGGAECSGCGGGVCVTGVCQEVDPCAGNGGCDVNATCTAILGGRACTCATGFDGSGLACAPALSDLTVSGGFLSPAFRPSATSYIVVLSPTTTTMTVAAATAARATISIDGVPGPSRTLTPGAAPQTVVVEVRATTGTASRRYSLLVSRSATTLSQRASLKPSNTRADFRFGATVAISGDGSTVAVGAPMESSDATGVGGNQTSTAAVRSGAVFVFRNTAGTWAQEAYVKASNTNSYDNFGWSVALSTDGSTLVVGASGEDGLPGDPSSNAVNDSGAVYVFRRTAGTWAQEAYLKSSWNDGRAGFGWAVAVSGDGTTLAAGAPFGGAVESAGAVYVFARSGSWSQVTRLDSGNPRRGDQFGRAVALSSDGLSLAVGAPLEDEPNNGGGAYVFRKGAGWALDAHLRPATVDAEDKFGAAVALSGDGSTLAVGAPGEGSDGLGLGGDAASNGAPASGAVFLWTRATTWSQSAYVKATNTGDGDRFGTAVGLSADGATLVVGAPGDDSDAAAIDGNQASNAFTDSGSVFVYRKATSWARLAYAKPSQPGAGDTFGLALSVSASGATWVTGAVGDDSAATGVNGDLSGSGAQESGAAFLFAE